MNPELADALQKVAQHTDAADELARAAALFLPEEPMRAKEAAGRASVESQAALSILRGLGHDPMQGPRPHAPQKNPLAELVKLDASRPEALALLDALRVAHQLAEALDAKRGDVLDAPVGGSAGLVWGDRLYQAVCGLESEISGPSERVTGGRE